MSLTPSFATKLSGPRLVFQLLVSWVWHLPPSIKWQVIEPSIGLNLFCKAKEVS